MNQEEMEKKLELVCKWVEDSEEEIRGTDPTFMTSPLKEAFLTLQKQFPLLKIFTRYSQKLLNFVDHNLPSAIRAIEAIDSFAGVLEEREIKVQKQSDDDDDDDDFDVVYDEAEEDQINLGFQMFVEKLKGLNPILKQGFQELSNLLLERKVLSREDLKEILDIGIQSLKDLRSLKPDLIAPVSNQIGAIEKRLEFISAIFHFALRHQNIHQLNSFFNHIEYWAKIAVGVPFLYFVDDEIYERVNDIVSELIEKFKPCTVHIAELYLGALKALKPSQDQGPDFYLKGIAVGRFLEVLLEDLILPSEDGFEMLQHGLTFFISFLVDPPPKSTKVEKFTFIDSNLCVDEAASLICSLYACKSKEGLVEGTNTLHDLVEKINQVRLEIRELEHEISSWDNFPRTNVQGFLDSFIEGLNEKQKYGTLTIYQSRQVMTIHKLLFSLKPLLTGVFEFQNEIEELNHLQWQIIKMAYRANYVIDICFLSNPTKYWQTVMCLSNVIEEIQVIGIELNQSRYTQMRNTKVLDGKRNSEGVLPPQAINNIMVDDVMVGFTTEKENIINCLVGGLPQLDIVAIVGMPGQGKTTLARKVFHEPFVRLHFQRYAWCCISQGYRIKDILTDIVKQVDPTIDISNKCHEALAEMLYRCLKGKTYLVVLDDIWDIEPWKELKASFPNDENGSRIMFTSRIHKIAFEAKSDCSLHELRPLSLEESIELLQQKLSSKDGFPANFLDMGRTIAESCKGLPLAIVLIAGVLAKENGSISFWEQIVERLKSQVAMEGCMDVLEISYKQLPPYLIPCFLYLAAFPEDEQILAKSLTRYWIAEGFVQKRENKSLEDVANEYLADLVGRSLLFVAKRSSTYGIKKCVVHDVVREFCLEKAKEKNFLLVTSSSNNNFFDTMHQWYRLCLSTECWASFESKHTFLVTRTLIYSEPMEYPYTLLSFKVLVILDLASIMTRSYIVAIMQLVHLRYLALRGAFLVPPSIVNLSRLELLVLISSWVKCNFPKAIWNMKSLRHLYLGGSNFRGMDDWVDESIQLDNLETFLSYRTCSKEELQWQLKRMPNVRKLGVRLNFGLRLSDILSKIESLNLWAEVKLSATEFNLPSSLIKLRIEGAIMSESVISAIGKLPHLEVFKSSGISFEDQTWNVEDDEFLNLKYLKLRWLEIEQWNVSTDSFPQLQQLILKKCPKLSEIPLRFGELLTLKVIRISQCEQLANSVQEIVEAQKELGNEDLKIATDFSSN
ncbi:hypothetical protein M9H77_28001 [Catharanthus roseus]|uniref:Uncharacterized protein n=1 Tax=Catharanthus roseus TaxID=4058 RepID=A0ACC0AGT7_CATRO|nr:hypothetical protein M9H77_28001 [Catharanthus roseus]